MPPVCGLKLGVCSLCQKDPQFRDAGYNDMVDMTRLNNAELAYNLKIRAVNKEPYCRCGVTLVAINLYEPRESYAEGGANHHLYSDETLRKNIAQRDRDAPDVKPHPWSLASHCYKEVFETGDDQSIVITGGCPLLLPCPCCCCHVHCYCCCCYALCCYCRTATVARSEYLLTGP